MILLCEECDFPKLNFFRILEDSVQQEPVVMAQLPSPPTKEVILVVEDVEAEVAAVSASALRLRKFESRLALLESQVNSLLRKCQTQIGNNNAVIGQKIPKYRAGSCASVLET